MLLKVKFAILVANFTNLAFINLQQIQQAPSTNQIVGMC